MFRSQPDGCLSIHMYFASQGFSVRYILAKVFRSAIFGERSGPKILGYIEDGTYIYNESMCIYWDHTIWPFHEVILNFLCY